MKNFFLTNLMFLFAISIFCDPAMASTKQTIAGAGPSTIIVQKFAESFSKLPEAKGIEFEVPSQSSKHKGGIISSDYNLFGRTGRPLNAKEKALNKEEIFLARVPVAIVVGISTGITQLTLSQLEGIVTGRITNWKEVGGTDHKITVVGRESTEALFSVMKRGYPFFERAHFQLKFNKDNHVVKYFQKNLASQYAISFGALPNFANASKINIIPIEGFESGVSLGLVYDIKNKDNSIVQAAKKFASSKEWKDIVIQEGLLPAK